MGVGESNVFVAFLLSCIIGLHPVNRPVMMAYNKVVSKEPIPKSR